MKTIRPPEMHPIRATLIMAVALFIAGCTGSRVPAADSPSANGEDGVDLTTGELVQVAQVSRAEAQELGGPNKPNGLEYRYRRWVPDDTPAYVPRQIDSLDLAIAEETADGWLALYESPLRDLGTNRTYRAVMFGPDGDRVWDVNLNAFFSRPDYLEVQDMRYEDGHLYFNEACQTYAAEAGGECSALVSIDPPRGALDWRTPPLTSNDIFIFYGPYIIAGYGFTNEQDYLYMINRTDGEIVEREPLDSAHDYLEINGQTLRVVTYDSVYKFTLPVLTTELDQAQ